MANAQELLKKLDKQREILTGPETPENITMATGMLEEHASLKRRIQKSPLEGLDKEGHFLLERICGSRHKSQGLYGNRIEFQLSKSCGRHKLSLDNQGVLMNEVGSF